MENEENNLTRNRKIILSVPDIIAIGTFLISMGISIGVYSSAMSKLENIEVKIDNLSEKIEDLNANSASYGKDLDHINKDIERLKDKK